MLDNSNDFYYRWVINPKNGQFEDYCFGLLQIVSVVVAMLSSGYIQKWVVNSLVSKKIWCNSWSLHLKIVLSSVFLQNQYKTFFKKQIVWCKILYMWLK